MTNAVVVVLCVFVYLYSFLLCGALVFVSILATIVTVVGFVQQVLL